MAKRGKVPLKTLLRLHPQAIMEVEGNIVAMHPILSDGTIDTSRADLRDIRTEKILARWTIDANEPTQSFQCPTCGHLHKRTLRQLAQFIDVAVSNGRDVVWFCNHGGNGKPATVFLSIRITGKGEVSILYDRFTLE